MRLLIIGASRGIGLELVKQALAEGHQVTALARHIERITLEHSNLSAIQGDILNLDSVAKVVEGQDAVCITIGMNPTLKPVRIFSEGTNNVLDAMHKHAVKRLLCVTGIGAGDSKGHGGFLYDKIFNPLMLKTIYHDKDLQESMVRQAGIDWVIVRPGFLTHGAKTGEYKMLTDLSGITAGRISRADVADFILKQCSYMSFLKQTPLLTYK